MGEPQEAASVGSSGDWQLRGPGVEPIHAYLYFDGDALYVQSALEARELICGGRRVGNDWELVSVADVIEIGTARITLSQTTQSRSGASAVARAPAAPATPPAPAAPAPAAPPALASQPVARAIIAPQGAEAVTGEERTAFLPLDGVESQRTLQEADSAPRWSAGDDDQEATRMPGLPVPAFGHDEDEATRMVSLEGKAAVLPRNLEASEPVITEDPYDDLQERTHASTGASAVVPYRPDTALPFTPTGPVQLATSQANAQAPRNPSKIERRSEPPPAPAERLPEPQAYGSAVVKPKSPDPAPNSYPTPEPRAGWAGEVLKNDASRARASAEILGPSGASRAAPVAISSEANAASRSIGEMTRVAPLGPEAEAKRKAAIAAAVARETPPTDTPAIPLGAEDTKPRAEDTKRRKQKTARVRGPDGSGEYVPPPPPMALPQEETKEKPKKPPSGLKKAFDAFADHFEEVNTLRKILYLTSPFVLLTAAYILFGPDPPPPSAQGPAIKAAEPPAIASSATAVLPPPDLPKDPIARPDAGEIPVDSDMTTTSADAGAPSGKKDPKAPKTLTPERLAADAYAAGQLDKAIGLYRDLLARPEPMDPMRGAALTEVLRILEAKRASGQHEMLEQAPPLKSAR